MKRFCHTTIQIPIQRPYCSVRHHTIVETDHSPLEQIFKKNINEVPARLQNMILWCLRFNIAVVYKPGVKIPVADELSRVCIPKHQPEKSRKNDVDFITGVKTHTDVQRIKDESLRDSTVHKSCGTTGTSDVT